MDIKEKIKNLLNRTTANGCTEGEAAAAIAKAHELLAKYNLTMSDLGEEQTSNIYLIETETKSLSSIQAIIAFHLSKHFGVVIFKSSNRSTNASQLKCIGEKDKVDIFSACFHFAYSAFKHNWAAYHRTLNCSTKQKSYHRGSYLKGFVKGFVDVLEEQENKYALVVRPSEKTLAIVRDMKMSNASIHLKTGSNDSYNRGYQDGENAHKQKKRIEVV